jgi:hypothetical protein
VTLTLTWVVVVTCVEPGSNTSTVILRVVEGDEKGSQIWDSKIRSRAPRGSDPRKTAVARASSIYKIQTRPLVREGAPQRKNVTITPRLINWPTVSRNVPLTYDRVLSWQLEDLEAGVRWPPACEDASSKAEERPLLKPLPSTAVKAVTENTNLLLWLVKCIARNCVNVSIKPDYQSKPTSVKTL